MIKITVTGLPRSGTAFVSAMLNLNPNAIAYHERGAYNFPADESYHYVIDCTTVLFTGCDKMVVIDSDPVYSSARSFHEMRLNGIDPTQDGYMKLVHDMNLRWRAALEEAGQQAEVLWVNRLFDMEALKKIWRFCFEEEFPEHKVEQLLKLRICHKTTDLLRVIG